MRDIRMLNFNKLLSIDVPDIGFYTFDEYRENGYEHKPIRGYCISCEEKGCSVAKDDDSFRLANISHGAHSSDFFRALQNRPDTSDWHQEPVMFVYESPDLNYGIFKEADYKGYRKHPAKKWCWIQEDREAISYPVCFWGNEFGGFVLSVIQTFKLTNVYMTNLVKCGLNNDGGICKDLSSYQDETVKNCYAHYLAQEISILKPKIIFAVGSVVEAWLKWFVKPPILVQHLPHPAGCRSGLRDEQYRAVYFWGIVRTLHKTGIIDTDEGSMLARMYLDKYDI